MELWVFILVLALAMLLGAYLGVKIERLRRDVAARKAAAKAAKEKEAAAAAAAKSAKEREDKALKLLEAEGYKVLSRGAGASYAVSIDDEPQVVHIAADFVLERAGKKLVGELKAGKAAQLDTFETRGQLLEHQLAFGVRSVLVIDVEAGSLQNVRFPVGKNVLTAVAAPPPRPAAPAPAAPTAKKSRTAQLVALAVAAYALFWLLSAGRGRERTGSDTHEARESDE